jgi:hypothetical protein
MPSMITANNIWVEFTSTIRARLNHIKGKANWWTYRDAVQLVPKVITKQNLEDIEVEQTILLALLPNWEHLGSCCVVMLDKLGSLCYGDTIVHKGSGSYTLPQHIPCLIPTGDMDHSQTNGRWHARCSRQDSSCLSWNFKLF